MSEQGLGECKEVIVVNTGTSPEATASATIRLVEHLGAGRDACTVLATTSGSRERAEEAAEWVRGILGGSGPRVLLDTAVLGKSLYADLPESPETAIEAVKNGAIKIGSRLRVVDITGGVKLEAVLAVLIAVISQRHREGKEDIVLSYTPGQAFSRPSQLRGVTGSGWWSNQWYPHTPRALQPLLVLRLGNQMSLSKPECRPSILSPPSEISIVPIDEPNRLHEAIGGMTRLLNYLACSRLRVAVHGDGEHVTLLEADWLEPRITWVSKSIEDPNALIRDRESTDLDSFLALGRQEDAMRKCLNALLKLAAHEPLIHNSRLKGFTGKTFSEVLVEIIEGYDKTILLDTSAALNGALNSILAAETLIALKGQRMRPSAPRIYIHRCTLVEVMKWYEYAKNHYTLPNPCAALALVAELHLRTMSREPVGEPTSYCDPVLVEHANKHNYIILTSDKGIINMLHTRTQPDYLYAAPTPLWRKTDKIQKHRVAATITQLVLYLALATPPKTYIRIEGDHATAKIYSKQLGKIVIEIEKKKPQHS